MEKDNFFCKRKEGIEDYIAEHICLNAPVITGLKPFCHYHGNKGGETDFGRTVFRNRDLCD